MRTHRRTVHYYTDDLLPYAYVLYFYYSYSATGDVVKVVHNYYAFALDNGFNQPNLTIWHTGALLDLVVEF